MKATLNAKKEDMWKYGNIDKWQEYTEGQYSGHPFCKKCFVALRSKPEDEIVSYIKSFYFGNIILVI